MACEIKPVAPYNSVNKKILQYFPPRDVTQAQSAYYFSEIEISGCQLKDIG
jgi:hypothetical protein